MAGDLNTHDQVSKYLKFTKPNSIECVKIIFSFCRPGSFAFHKFHLDKEGIHGGGGRDNEALEH